MLVIIVFSDALPPQLPIPLTGCLPMFQMFSSIFLVFCTHVADFVGLGNTLLCQRQSRDASPKS